MAEKQPTDDLDLVRIATLTLDHDDPTNPVNFSRVRKLHIVVCGIWFAFTSAMASSLPSGANKEIAHYFSVTSSTQIVLLNSCFMIGFVAGPLVFGPLSEHVGRRPVFLTSYSGFCVFMLASAVAPTYSSLLGFRFLGGLCASAPHAVVGGLIADIFDDPRQRGTAMAYFAALTAEGPQLSPIVSGFLGVHSWRWVFWFGFGLVGLGLPAMLMMPETFAPVLLRKRSQAEQQAAVDGASKESIQALTGKPSLKEIADVLRRPFRMIVQEPIVLFTCIYLAFVYAILYLFFQAYPIIFQDMYGLNPGIAGLAFVPMMVGGIASLIAFLWYSSWYARNCEGKVEEVRRLPLACLGGPMLVFGIFWLAWLSFKSIHPIVPMLSGFFFSFGFQLIFMSMLNYLSDAYKQYSASAQAASSATRSVCAVCLPLATKSMYSTLGIHWATSLIGFVALILATIPFVFLKYGQEIRARSPFCQRSAGSSAGHVGAVSKV